MKEENDIESLSTESIVMLVSCLVTIAVLIGCLLCVICCNYNHSDTGANSGTNLVTTTLIPNSNLQPENHITLKRNQQTSLGRENNPQYSNSSRMK